MQLAKIVGNVVSSCAHKSVEGHALFLCQPIDEFGRECGDIVAAVSPFGGGLGSTVVLSADGAATRGYVGDPKSPLRMSITAVVDEIGFAAGGKDKRGGSL